MTVESFEQKEGQTIFHIRDANPYEEPFLRLVSLSHRRDEYSSLPPLPTQKAASNSTESVSPAYLVPGWGEVVFAYSDWPDGTHITRGPLSENS